MTQSETQPKISLTERMLKPGPMGTAALTIGLVAAVIAGAENGVAISALLLAWLVGWAIASN